MKKPRVLVTRPEPGNSRTTIRLQEAGFDPVALPLTEVAARPCPVPDIRPDAVAISSPNAIRHASAELLEALRSIPVYTVGAASADIARESGLEVVHVGTGDAAALARHMVEVLPRGSVTAYPCGVIRRSELEDIFNESGLDIIALETYETNKVSYSTEKLSTLLSDLVLDAVLLHSAESAKALNILAASDMRRQITEKTAIIALSKRILEALDLAFHGPCLAVSEPREADMIALLGEAILPRRSN